MPSCVEFYASFPRNQKCWEENFDKSWRDRYQDRRCNGIWTWMCQRFFSWKRRKMKENVALNARRAIVLKCTYNTPCPLLACADLSRRLFDRTAMIELCLSSIVSKYIKIAKLEQPMAFPIFSSCVATSIVVASMFGYYSAQQWKSAGYIKFFLNLFRYIDFLKMLPNLWILWVLKPSLSFSLV